MGLMGDYSKVDYSKYLPEDVKTGKRKVGKGELFTAWQKARRDCTPEEALEWRDKFRAACKEAYQKRLSGPAYMLLRPHWRIFVDMLPGLKWNYGLALTKVDGLPRTAYRNFGSYLNRSPVLQRAIEEKRNEYCPSKVGKTTQEELEAADRIRDKVMKDLEHLSNFAESDAVKVKALELLAKTQGMFIDREEHKIGLLGEGDASRARERMAKFVANQRVESHDLPDGQ
jgi:hypothetical protein